MKKIIGFLAITIGMAATASTIGMSNHPFTTKKHIITTEYNSYFSDSSGMGLNANYSQRISETMTVDTGFGITNGDKSSRLHLGADLQILPDYGRQPKLSLKAFGESENISEERINSFGIAPTLSKGFAFWGKEAFPFIALPMKVSLNTARKDYETSTSVALGVTGRLPIDGASNLVGNVETNFDLNKSGSSIVMGVSLPIE